MDPKMKLAIYNKEYRLNNQERLNANKKKIYQINKAILAKKRLIFVRCDCGSIVSEPNFNKHVKTSVIHRKRLAINFDKMIDSFFV
jgi:hypothetical protein